MPKRRSSRVENDGFIRQGDGKFLLILLLLAGLGVATFIFGIDYELRVLGGNTGLPLPIIGTGMVLISILLSVRWLFWRVNETVESKQKKKRWYHELRWYHVFFPVMLPYIGLPWGIINLCRSRFSSGLTMVVISLVVLMVVLYLISLENAMVP
jgi:uncharacterized protein HemY